MSYTIMIVGLATGQPTLASHQYVEEYTPNGYGGRGDLVLTPIRSRAKRYPTQIDAWEEWKRVSKTHPVRPDGKPNRPMTAFTITVEPY